MSTTITRSETAAAPYSSFEIRSNDSQPEDIVEYQRRKGT
jgi:hypothetical protein